MHSQTLNNTKSNLMGKVLLSICAAGILSSLTACNVTKRLTTDPLLLEDNPTNANNNNTAASLQPEDFVATQFDHSNATDTNANSQNPVGIDPTTSDSSSNNTNATIPPNDGVSLSVNPAPRPEYFDSAKPGVPVTVGGLVGQVNGRPIYVDDVFAPIADELAIMGQQMGYTQFAQQALQVISERVRRMVEIELLLAEATNNLTEPQRQGLLHFIKNFEEGLIREGGGSAERTDQQMLSSQGISLDEQVDKYRDEILIQETRREIYAKIVVTWRDVTRYYREHPEEFDPPASIQLRVIIINKDDTTKQDQVKAALAAGHPFELAAEDYSDLLASSAGLMAPIALKNGRQNAQLTIWPQVNAAAATLGVGQSAGPFVEENHVVWLQIENYQDGAPIPLRDAQKAIERKLTEQLFQQESARYFQKLLARGNFDDLEMMATSLLAVALDRWAPIE